MDFIRVPSPAARITARSSWLNSPWYLGTVVKTTNFGAFISLVPGRDGLLHISEVKKLAPGKKRLETVEEVLNVGDKVQVEIKEVDPRGKLSLVPVIEEEAAAETADA